MSLTLPRLIPCFTIAIFLGLSSCQAVNEDVGKTESTPKQNLHFYLNSPSLDAVYKLSDGIAIAIASGDAHTLDSVQLYIGRRKVYSETASPNNFTIQGIFTQVGSQNIRVKMFSEAWNQTRSVRILLLADTPPEELSYTVLNKFPHDPGDYTQGLLYHDGYLYESTGQVGHSRLAKKKISDGSTLLEHRLDRSIFGEGLALVGDTLYQLTYMKRIGFMYKVSDFSLLGTFNLQTAEGWGLDYDGHDLIQTDGSAQLYFHEPGYYNPGKVITVADNKRLIQHLNELEYAQDALWANIYTTNLIVKIDPKSGEVLGRLNLEKLFPQSIPRDMDHVLNGIAYNPDRGTFYVTGKLWPVLYEIRIN